MKYFKDLTPEQRLEKFFLQLHRTHPGATNEYCYTFPDYLLEAMVELVEHKHDEFLAQLKKYQDDRAHFRETKKYPIKQQKKIFKDSKKRFK